MRAYFQLFFALLVPLSGLFIAASVIYFKMGYDLTKAMRLGVLSGFFIALAVSLFTALFLLIMRRGKQPKKSILKRKKKVPIPTTSDTTQDTTMVKTSSIATTKDGTLEQKIMLLMDKELAFEILLHTITTQHIGILTKDPLGKGDITVKNDDEILQISLLTLTRHTSQMLIQSEINSKAAKKLIHCIKEKEYSFLQY